MGVRGQHARNVFLFPQYGFQGFLLSFFFAALVCFYFYNFSYVLEMNVFPLLNMYFHTSMLSQSYIYNISGKIRFCDQGLLHSPDWPQIHNHFSSASNLQGSLHCWG